MNTDIKIRILKLECFKIKNLIMESISDFGIPCLTADREFRILLMLLLFLLIPDNQYCAPFHAGRIGRCFENIRCKRCLYFAIHS